MRAYHSVLCSLSRTNDDDDDARSLLSERAKLCMSVFVHQPALAAPEPVKAASHVD